MSDAESRFHALTVHGDRSFRMVVSRAGHDTRVHGWHVSTRSALRGLFCGGLTLWVLGCGTSNDPASIMLAVGGMAPDADTGGVDPAHQAITSLPAGFTATDIGGFQLGGRVEAGARGGRRRFTVAT
jgi:hypothetical protein